MRSHCAIYVDVGYLLAAAATRVTGTSLRRGVQVDHPELIRGLIERAEADSGLPLLRVNWYDSGARPGGMPDFVQDEIGLLPRVKLRLGRLSHAGEQKGVDLRIGLDLATHGRNRVVDVIYLVSGDDDLTEAVEEAQGHGVQVILLAVPGQDNRPHGVARHLQRAADGLILLDGEMIDRAVRTRAIPEALIPDEHRPDTEPPATDGAEPALTGEAAAAPTDGAALDGAALDGAALDSGAADGAALDGAAPEPAGRARPTEPAPQDATEPDGDREPALAGPTPATGAPASPRDAAAAPTRTGQTRDGEPDADGAAGRAAEPELVPTPSLFAKKKATSLVPPPEPVGTSPTAVVSGGYASDIEPEVIDLVARQVIRSWCTTATPQMLAELKDQRPSIPGDLDRAMLVDLSNRSGQYDIDEASRHELRSRFWHLVDQIKLS